MPIAINAFLNAPPNAPLGHALAPPRPPPAIRAADGTVMSSISLRMRPRARCSSTRWFSAEIPNSTQASSADWPSMSRSTSTAFWPAGRFSSPASTCSHNCRPAITRSGSSSSHSRGISPQCPPASNADNGTARSSPADPSNPAGNPTIRPSRTIRVRARFITILNNQVDRLDRPSKFPIAPSTASQVSCTTSSACALLPITVVATPTKLP